MSSNCPPAPANKKEYVSEVGKILVEHFGKKRYYTPEEIEQANKQTKWYNKYSCWGTSVFSSHEDFDKHHQVTGEVCDYAAMKTEMLSGMVSSSNSSWFDLSSLELSSIAIDASWLEFGDTFETIFDGIGEVVGGILDGL
ncbi:MAG TPA: hypothetical protein DCR04_08095 [Flavobacteriales bacterium]|nr:hypothetical protein [Flavobacteriales bacterium]